MAVEITRFDDGGAPIIGTLPRTPEGPEAGETEETGVTPENPKARDTVETGLAIAIEEILLGNAAAGSWEEAGRVGMLDWGVSTLFTKDCVTGHVVV